MGGRSGGGGGSTAGGARKPKKGGLTGDGNFGGEIKNPESLIHMKDSKMYQAVGKAISRYHSVLGVREKNVKLADLPLGVMGVQVSQGGSSTAVYLGKAYFKGANASKVHAEGMKRQYKEHWQTKTNQPLAHVVTHELGHATWNSSLSSPQARAAAPAINKLYKSWLKDRPRRKGYGDYAKSSVDEFWAEACTKAVHGNSDRYTRAVKSIIRKYKL